MPSRGWATSRATQRRAVGLGLFLVVAFAGLDNVAVGFLATEVFGASAVGLGLLGAVYGVEMVLAPLALLRFGTHAPPASALLLGIGLMGAGARPTGLAPAFALALAMQGLAGAGNGLENVANDTLVQRTVPRALLGRTFGAVYSGASVGETVAFAAGGPLVDLIEARGTYAVASCGTVATLALVRELLRAARSPTMEARSSTIER